MGYNPTVNNAEVPATSSFWGKFFVYISFLLITPIFLFILSRNNLIRNKEKIEETASDIDIQLKQRVHMLTKLIDSTKQYMKYEKDTLSAAVELRTQANKNLNVKELDQINNAVTSQVGKIN
ncbi:LemA family protein [Spiroplasma citri]|uniref:LemA family protein n=1 Tax=Spiroplasma citri TaxID=2133 RepID=UPI002412AD2F|nr:LemA family protein [Spiroplasma citri]